MAIKPLPNEKDLLANIAIGDERAFAQLFQAYHEPVASYIYTLLESVQLAEEIVQDVFVKLWQQRESLPNLEKFTSYLFILTRNYTINCIRRIARDQKLTKLYVDEALEFELEAEHQNEDPNYQDILNRAVAQLPPSQQQVLQLRQQGLKTREIAEQMGITTDSVKKYQQWAAQSVSKFLKAHAALSLILMFGK